MVPQEQCKAGFIDAARRQFEYCLRSLCLRSRKLKSIHFEKENSHNEARTLVSVDKGMVLDDARSISRGHFDDVRVGVRRFEQPLIPQATYATMS